MNPPNLRFVAITIGVSLLAIRPSPAATFTFGAPTVITSNAALDAPQAGGGSLLQAVSFGGGGTTVTTPSGQSILFQTGNAATGTPPAGGDNFTLYGVNGGYAGTETIGAIFNPAGTTVDANFAQVLQSHAYSGYGGNEFYQLTLNGLTVGQSYALQLISVDDRNGNSSETYHYSDGTNSSATFSLGSNSYVLATFVADAATQSFTEIKDNSQELGFTAYTLYAVPEPSTWTALALGSAGLLVLKRRRRA